MPALDKWINGMGGGCEGNDVEDAVTSLLSDHSKVTPQYPQFCCCPWALLLELEGTGLVILGKGETDVVDVCSLAPSNTV